VPVTADILVRRVSRFVLWSPRGQSTPPVLVIGELKVGNPPVVANVRRLPLAPAVGVASGLWEVLAADCQLVVGSIYHYWFEVEDSRAPQNAPARVTVTDPFAGCVDWRVFPPGARDFVQPAAVVRYASVGRLEECDPNGELPVFPEADAPDRLAANNQLVIYELPTAWTLSRSFSEPERGAATFLDVAALADETLGGVNFAELQVLGAGRAHLVDLGVNAVELLPPADSRFNREWGYGTSHYLAPDYELGYPDGNLSPTANRDLTTLVASLKRKNIRFFVDVVMAFAQEDPYNRIDAANFHIDNPKDTPNDDDAMTSGRSGGRRDFRNGFGSTLWRYAKFVNTYDPLSGDTKSISPAAQFMLVYVTRWANDFRVDGLRLDSVENVANWGFVQAFKNRGREVFADRWTAAGLNPAAGGGGDMLSRFLVVGEELELPFDLIRGGRLDGLWNEPFQARVRAAILGESTDGDTFELTVRKAINCLSANGFTDGAQAINYITKHDVEGYRHERLFTMLSGMPPDQIEKRIKLAHVCLLTAVGIPMILAGEEFADQHDFFGAGGAVSQNGGKQVDPVNFSRLTAQAGSDPGDPDKFFAEMRRRIFSYVKTLVKLRTAEPALAVNDTDFIWTDFGDGKRVLVWRRGGANHPKPIIVVANFSDFGSAPGTDYRIPTWPTPTPPGKRWIEVTQGRTVDPALVGREAIFPWEAKVYTLVA
jgi:pullulanase